MGNTIGMIFGNCRSDVLMGLTANRPIAAVPFGGRYRLMDFVLSNMVNSGLRTVGIITPHHYRPILDHLKSGKDWFLDRKTGGLFILPGLDYSLKTSGSGFLIRDLINNIDFLKKDRAENVIMSCCSLIINLNFKDVLQFHQQKGADITFVYKEEELPPGTRRNELYLEIDEQDRVNSFSSWLNLEKAKKRNSFLEVFIIKKHLLLQLLENYDAINSKDLLEVIAGYFEELKVFGYQFTGYVGKIASVKDYFDRSMELLDLDVQKELFAGKNKIHTKINDNPPSLYGPNARVTNSLVASGCKIEGSAENSILFREVKIEKGAMVKNCIIMQKSRIGANAILENVILDKFAFVESDNIIMGKKNQPVVIKKGATVGLKGGVS